MNINELEEELRVEFTPKRGYGITKITSDKYQNIYFIVPPPPSKNISGNMPYPIIGEALKVLGQLPNYREMNELNRPINYLFVRREVVQSSRLEGTWSTIDHALTPGELIESAEGKSEHKAVM